MFSISARVKMQPIVLKISLVFLMVIKKVAELATQFFIEDNKPNITGLVLAGWFGSWWCIGKGWLEA